MTTLKHFALSLAVAFVLPLAAFAQEGQQPRMSAVNVTPEPGRVRVSPVGQVFDLQVEVLDDAGEVVFEAAQAAPGQPLDWNLRDARGSAVPPGTYTVTASYTTAAGKTRKRVEQVTVTEEAPTTGGAASAGAASARAAEPSPQAVATITGEGNNGRLARFTGPNSVASSVVHQSGTGNIGVGTTAPTAKLEVNGNVKFAGLRTEANATSPNVVGGFSGNSVTAGLLGATIGGGGQSGSPNIVGGSFGVVGGGFNNLAGGGSTIGGGANNLANGGNSTIAGGQSNQAGGGGSTIGGGSSNIAQGGDATIGGGLQNFAGGFGTTVGGGFNNFADGSQSTVPGGILNRAEGDFSFAAGQRAKAAHTGAFVWSDSTTSDFDFFASTAPDQFLINAAGGVGINTNAPTARLHVAGSSSSVAAPITALESSGSQVPLAFKSGGAELARVRADSTGNLVMATVGGSSRDILFRAGDDSITDLFIDSGASRVGVGTVSPTAKLDVNGTLRVRTLGSGGTAACFNSSNVISSCSSSIRYKERVAGFTRGLELVGRLRPVSFRWKEDGLADFGLVAEEVASVEPLLTHKNEKGEIEGVKYDRLPVLLIRAVQEQQEQIERLRALVTTQQAQLQQQQAQLDQVKRAAVRKRAAKR
jgi:hypothetical protein